MEKDKKEMFGTETGKQLYIIEYKYKTGGFHLNQGQDKVNTDDWETIGVSNDSVFYPFFYTLQYLYNFNGRHPERYPKPTVKEVRILWSRYIKCLKYIEEYDTFKYKEDYLEKQPFFTIDEDEWDRYDFDEHDPLGVGEAHKLKEAKHKV